MVLLQCASNDVCENCFYSDAPSILIQLFFAILFLQSGFDKFFNYKSEYDWTKEHFSKSIFKNVISVLFPILTLMEVLNGILCLSAITMLLFFCNGDWFFYTSIFSSVTILSLFMGQRMAKDYAGASSLAVYFAVSILGIYLSY